MELDIVFDYAHMLQFHSFNIDQLEREFDNRIKGGTKMLLGFAPRALASEETERFFRTAANLREENKIEYVG